MPFKKIPVELKSLARSHAQSAVKTLQGIMINKKSQDSARVAAAIALLDRGYGRPKQSHEHGGVDGVDEIRITIRNITEERKQKT
jgi:hypothetical protein